MGKYNTTDRLDWIITLRVIAAIAIVLLHVVAGHSWVHMWYIYMLIGLYMLTPVLRSFVKIADEKEM